MVAPLFGLAGQNSGEAWSDARFWHRTGPLEALEQKSLLRAQLRSQYPGEREYTFKHDLIREVAYEMLPRTERRTASVGLRPISSA